MLLVPIVLFLGLGVAGILLLRGHPWGKTLSVAAQIVQLPKLFTTILSYEFYGPLTVSAGLKPEHWSLSLDLEPGGGFSFALNNEPVSTLVGINLAAAVVLWWLLRKPAVQPLPTSGGLVTR